MSFLKNSILTGISIFNAQRIPGIQLLRSCKKTLQPSIVASLIHTSNNANKQVMPGEPKNWPKYNEILYSPTLPGDELRPAEITHFKANIKYSTKKLWYIALMVRGLSIDEALKQLSFVERMGSEYIRDTILEAQEIAVRDHNVEFKSNLWIADSFTSKARTIKGVRKHARGRYGRISYRYSHYKLRLREGPPPTHYYTPLPNGYEKLQNHLQDLRMRRPTNSL